MALPVGEIAAADCCLFLWATWPSLLASLAIIEAWGFTYKTCAFDWAKVSDAGKVQIGLVLNSCEQRALSVRSARQAEAAECRCQPVDHRAPARAQPQASLNRRTDRVASRRPLCRAFRAGAPARLALLGERDRQVQGGGGMTEIKIHPAAECVRLTAPMSSASLAASIDAHGQRDPIILGRVNGAAVKCWSTVVTAYVNARSPVSNRALR